MLQDVSRPDRAQIVAMPLMTIPLMTIPLVTMASDVSSGKAYELLEFTKGFLK